MRLWTIGTLISAAITLILSGAIAGFFYAYSVSVMRGLDATDPQHAIAAMQGINATVRNALFAPAFFGTPVMAALTGALFIFGHRRKAGLVLILAAAVYVLGALLPTFLVNVPMNDALAVASIPADQQDAQTLWTNYSTRWTEWNHLRLAFSMLSLALVGAALFLAGRPTAQA
jgi:uncharacterized membrane protein